MSYNYEINNNIHKNINQSSKYTYANNEADTQTYIFELIIKDNSNNIKVIRRIKKCNQGNLVSIDDNLLYNMIDKYKLTILDINFPDKPIVIKKCIDNSLNTNSYLTNNVYLEINQTSNNLLEFNYHILSK